MTAQARDLTNLRFGKLIVLERTSRPGKRGVYWHCQCDCGAETVTLASNLTGGNSTSCGGCQSGGRRKYQDLTGETVAGFEVLGRADHPGKHARWLCRCTTCGAEANIDGRQLHKGIAKCPACVAKQRAEAKAEKEAARAARTAKRKTYRPAKTAQKAARPKRAKPTKHKSVQPSKRVALRLKKELDAAQRRQAEKLTIARLDLFTIREQITTLKDEKTSDPFLSANDHELIDGHIHALRGDLEQARERLREIKAA